MENNVNISSDEEKVAPSSKKSKRMTLIDFDKEILKAISETSIASLSNQSGDLQMFLTSTPKKRNSLIIKSVPNIPFMEEQIEQPAPPSRPRRYAKHRHHYSDSGGSTVISTPNLSSNVKDVEEVAIKPRKSSLSNRSSSTNGMSDDQNQPSSNKLNYSKSFNDTYVNNDKSYELNETRSISGSISSKGVHFCPVVSEVNWKDEHAPSTEHETSSNTSEPSPDRYDSTSTASTLPHKIDNNFNNRQIVSSSSEREINDDDLPFFLKRNNKDDLIRPEPRRGTPVKRLSTSHPDLITKKQEISSGSSEEDDFSFVPLRSKALSSSNCNDKKSEKLLNRRGSHFITRYILHFKRQRAWTPIM